MKFANLGVNRFFLFLLFINLGACTFSGQKTVQFEKIPPEEVTSNEKVLFIPVGEQLPIPVVSGTPPYQYRVGLGDATVDVNGNVIAPNFLTSGNILVTDVEGKTMVIPYVVVSKPQAGSSESLISTNDEIPIQVVGGKGPFTYEVTAGPGTIDEKGIYRPAGPGSATIEVTDSIGSKSVVNVTVQSPITVAQPNEVAAPGGSVNIADDVSGAIGSVTYEVISGEGSVSDSGVFTAPSTNGTTIIKISDGLGNVSYKEVVVSAGSSTPLRLQPPQLDVAVGKSVKLSSSGGAGSKQYQIVANASGSQIGQIGPGSIATSGEVVTFTAPNAVSEVSYTSIKVSDANAVEEISVVAIYPKPQASVESINVTVERSSTFTISSGKAPYAVKAGRGEIVLSGNSVSYTAPAVDGTDVISVKDSLGQEIYLNVIVNPGLQISPKKLSLHQDRYIYFVGVGGKAPHTYRMKDLAGNVVTSEADYGTLSADGLYHSPNKNAEFIVEVEDADGAAASARVSIYSAIAVYPAFAVTAASGEVNFEVSGGTGVIQASVIEGSGTVAEVSANLFKFTAASSVSSQSVVKLKFVDATGGEAIVVITVNPALAVTLSGVSSDAFAVGNAGIVSVSGGVPPYQMSMAASDKGSFVQTSETQGSFSGLKVGTFNISVRDAVNTTINKTITVQPQISVSPAQTTIDVLASESFTISGGVPPYEVEQPIAGKPLLGDGNLNFTGGATSFTYRAALALEQAVVRVKDALGNSVDVNVQNREVTVIATLSGVPASPTTQTSIDITVAGFGVSQYKYALTTNLFGCDHVGLTYSSATDISNHIVEAFPPVDNTHRLCVKGINSDGVEQTIATQQDWVLDSSNPTVNFATPALNSYINIANESAFSVTGTSSDDVTVVFKVGATQVGSVVASSGSWSTQLDFSAIATEGTVSVTAEITDLAGNSGSTSRNFFKDTIEPSGPSNISDSVYSNLTSASPVITFDPGSDTGSGLLKHRARVVLSSDNTNALSLMADFVTNNSISTSTLASGESYKVHMISVDNAGNESAAVFSNGWMVDTMAPTAVSSLVDGASTEVATESPAISWAASTDAASGLARYEVAVGSDTSANKTSHLAWTDVGLSISGVVLTGITSMTEGNTYYVSVRAIDNAGNISTEVSGDGFAYSNPCTPGSQTFTYTGSLQNFTTPAGCNKLVFEVWGAGGGAGSQTTIYGGGGGYVSAEVQTTGSESLGIIVGGGGHATTNGTHLGAGGGGRSAVMLNGIEKVIAGGGGGSGGASSHGAPGGGSIARNAIAIENCIGGKGGGLTAGGIGYQNGSLGVGGNAATSYAASVVAYGGGGYGGSAGGPNITGGGGGGGGYYGGGSGSTSCYWGGASWPNQASGGGGGSNYVDAGLKTISNLAGSLSATANSTSPGYVAGVGVGGIGSGTRSGGNGLVVVRWSRVTECVPGARNYFYTGSAQTFEMPSGCDRAVVEAWGAGGGAGNNAPLVGGGGGFASALINNISGQTFEVIVGGGGHGAPTGSYYLGAGGGGRSAIKISGIEKLIAGGGGGSGGANSSGAPGGGTAGSTASSIEGCAGGAGGTQSAGGAGYQNGSLGTGGNAELVYSGATESYGGGGSGGSKGGPNYAGAGGGGGGYYGGGSGTSSCYWGGAQWTNQSSGGGGGSSYVDAGLILLQNLSGSAGVAANSSHANYVSGIGAGGTFASRVGGNGMVRINWMSSQSTASHVIAYSASEKLIVMPSEPKSVTFTLWGAGGGASCGAGSIGGGGGFVKATLAAAADQVFRVKVGSGGHPGSGLNCVGAGGGGATTVYSNDTVLLVAGGGGGAGGSNGYGGPGGGTTGGSGISGGGCVAGTGGTQAAGGTGAVAGASLVGANGNTAFAAYERSYGGGGYGGSDGGPNYTGGGGGGGGYFGGGAGGTDCYWGGAGWTSQAGGGGGGSSYIAGSMTSTTNTQATTKNPAGTGEAGYINSAGLGGTEITKGSDGLAIISW
jgi:hypothetical protein